MFCSELRNRIQNWLRDYDRLQYLAVILIYIQIGCALIGSLGALYNGVMLINLAIALFALVAIESSSQSLGRTYAVLLFCSILLDISWFILFTNTIWNIKAEDYDGYYVFSVKLTLVMQIVGCFVRVSSSFLWIQIYRLGVGESSPSHVPDFDLRNSFLNPVTSVTRECSEADDALGGSIYDPAYYSSLFEDSQENKSLLMSQHSGSGNNESTSCDDAPQIKAHAGSSLQAMDENTDRVGIRIVYGRRRKKEPTIRNK